MRTNFLGMTIVEAAQREALVRWIRDDNRCAIHMDGTLSVLDNFSRYGASIRVLA